MSTKTKSQLKAYNNANIKTNNAKQISGAIHNTMNDDMIDSCVNKTDDNSLLGLFVYDTARSYVVGQGVLYSNNLYICTNNTTGTWDAADWSLIYSIANRDEFSFTQATIGSVLTFVSGYKYRRAHALNTYTPKFRITRPNGKVFSEADLDFTIIDANTIQIDFGFEIDTGTTYVLIEK
jgi:hypothetical protein